jgi:hypothetical protein
MLAAQLPAAPGRATALPATPEGTADPGGWMGAVDGDTSLRARWVLRPDDPVAAQTHLGAAGAALVARLARFGDLWVLEAPAESVGAVEQAWTALGELRRDAGGTPCLIRTTALVGVRPYVWQTLNLRGDPGSSIAILDSGCDTAHDDLGDPDFDNTDLPPAAAGDPDDWRDAAGAGFPANLALRVVGWHDVSDDMPGALGPYDYHRHGTALAGVAAGGGVVDPRLAGVAPQARLVIVKTYNFEGHWEVWASDLLLGIDWLLAHLQSYRVRACLIGATWPDDLAISDAVRALTQAGIAVICPIGNDPHAPLAYPARCPEAITVGATDPDGRLAAYNTPGDLALRVPDLVAPGGGSIDPSGAIVTCDNEPNDSYRGRVGTSLAAAHVAGAVSLISQALAEGGRVWRTDAAQVRWLTALLAATAVETQEYESTRPPGLRLDRGGQDPAEGFGLLQVDGAVDAVRRVIWPGDRAAFVLESPVTGSAVWSARLPVLGAQSLVADLSVPAQADFDLMLYRDTGDDVVLEAASRSPAPGTPESLQLPNLAAGWYVLVVKRISGKGTATLVTDQLAAQGRLWPLQLSAPMTVAPATYDLDGDGLPEIIAPNNVSIDASGHTIYVFRGDGHAFAPFPRTFFSASDRTGALTAPVVGDLGQGIRIVCGSGFGDVYGVGLDGVLKFQTTVASGTPTTGPALWSAAGQTRLVVGTDDGAAILDAAGAEVDRWVLGAGAAGPAAVGDVNGDGVSEVVIATQEGKIHARAADSALLPGWPVLRPPGVTLSAPVLVGDPGSGARVALTEQRADGSVWLLLLGADGALQPGFPIALGESGDAVVRALAGVVPSRLVRGGPIALLVPLVYTDAQGRTGARVQAVTLAGGSTPWLSVPLLSAAFAGAGPRIVRVAMGTPVVADVLSATGAESWFPVQLAWEETLEGTSQVRYGSVVRMLGYADGAPDPRLQWDAADGHQFEPALTHLPGVVADLDGDGRADLIVARGNRLYLQQGRQPTEPANFWTGGRGSAAQDACYACVAPPPVGTPPVSARPALVLRVRPNPFNPRAEIELEHAGAGEAAFTLLDARGRRVRQWHRALGAQGPWREPLQAQDGHGVGLASGIYQLVVEVAGERATAKVTLLR